MTATVEYHEQTSTWQATIHVNHKAVGSDAMPEKYLKDRRAVAEWIFRKYPAVDFVAFPVSGLNRNDGEIITKAMMRMPESHLSEKDCLDLANMRFEHLRNHIYDLQVALRDKKIDVETALSAMDALQYKLSEASSGLKEAVRVKKEKAGRNG